MRIALLYPDQRMSEHRPEPLGIQYLAASLAPRHEAFIIDGFGLQLSPRDVVLRCRDLGPDLIGISVPHNPQVPHGYECARLVREELPGVPIAWGGNYPTWHAREFVADGRADYVVKHEGDRTLTALVDALDSGHDPTSIPGLCCRRGGEIVDNGVPDLVPDLDQLPVLRHDLPGYPAPYGSFSVAASRGCPFRCANCSTSAFWLHRRRQRSVPSVMSEIDSLIDRHGMQVITFIDDLFTGKFRWVSDLCTAMIATYGQRSLKWVCNTRLDFLTEQLVRDMARAGLRRMFLGIESGSDRILQKLGKRYDADRAVAMLKLLVEVGVQPNVSLMMGLPWETREDLAATLSFLDRATAAVPYGIFSIKHVTPIHGTRLHDECERFGVTIIEDDQFDLDLLSARIQTQHLQAEDINSAFFAGRIMIDRAARSRSSAES